jgi:hypothetical protein
VKSNLFNLEEVIPTDEQINLLYEQLCKREFFISHAGDVPYDIHSQFVKRHPYRKWFLVKYSNEYIGNLYLGEDNSIGINNLDKLNAKSLKRLLDIIYANYLPLDAIASVRSGYFHINVCPDNKLLIERLQDLNFTKFQVSFMKK